MWTPADAEAAHNILMLSPPLAIAPLTFHLSLFLTLSFPLVSSFPIYIYIYIISIIVAIALSLFSTFSDVYILLALRLSLSLFIGASLALSLSISFFHSLCLPASPSLFFIFL